MKQSDLFLQGEGDRWHERNRDKPRLPDPVIEAMKTCHLQPKAVLELGCGNGWRLAEIQKIWPVVACRGYDASKEATSHPVHPNAFNMEMLAALKSIVDARYDTIIFGFCLYLVDREDLMMIAAHTDRVLQDKGHIIIHDFYPSATDPHKRAYHHKEGVWSYKMQYVRLWTSNPVYGKGFETYYRSAIAEDGSAVCILQKDIATGWPERAEC